MIKIIEKSIDELVPYENNARINDKAVDIVVNSIKEFGFKNPCIIDKNNVIVAGHTRVLACKKLGIDKVPCIVADDLTEEQIKAFRIADNSSAQIAEWDIDKLMKELETIDYDMEQFGLAEQLEQIQSSIDNNNNIEEDDYEEPENLEPKVKRGEIYQLGNHRLMCGDSTKEEDVAKLMNGNKADMVFTDPPYGMGLNTDYSSLSWGDRKGKKYEQGIVDDFNPKMIEIIFSLNIKEIFLWGADYYSEYLKNKNDGSWIVWDKTLESNGDAGSNSEFELCWSKQKHKRKVIHFNWFRYFGLSKQDINKRIHPTQKPLQVINYFLENYSKNNNIILDLFGGSGSTLIACEQLDRICYMMELDEHYATVIVDRWEKLTGQKAVKIN